MRSLTMLICLACFTSLTIAAGRRRDSRYDKSVHVFSPDGDILQVEYAERAASRGRSLLCLVSGSRLLVFSPTEKLDALVDRSVTRKINKVDKGMWMGFAGLAGDGRELLRIARDFVLEYRSKFGTGPSISAIANTIGNIQHATSLKGAERPFGVHVLLFGFDLEYGDRRPVLYLINASGVVTSWRGVAIGQHASALNKKLEEQRIDLAEDLEDCIRRTLAIFKTDADVEPEFDVSLLTLDEANGVIESHAYQSSRDKAIHALLSRQDQF
jgi:20S proteasome subunit alpha 4